MKKILFATVCATTLFLGAAAINAQEMVPPAPHGEMTHPAPCPCMKDGFGHKGFNKGGEFDHEKMKERMEQRADKFADELGLSPEQKEQAKKLHEDGRKEIEPLIKEMKNTREKMDALRDKNMKDFENILTPEQKDKLEKMKAEKKPEGKKKWFEGKKRSKKGGKKGEGKPDHKK
ncbi:MAG: hypothetical protein LBR70_04495 [Lactobacillaceae bacterium]|jgi:Spy/CpxP family protein refolding chaperone|nr:hypothetical protein [Lactobacillaceae bacterium]